MINARRLWVSAALAAMSCFGYGQAHWATAVSGNWSDTTKWAGGTTPTSGTVYIDYAPWSLTGVPGSFSTTLNYNVSLTSILTKADFTLAGVTLNLASAGSIFDGAFTMTGGTINNGGATVNGTAAFTGTDKTLNATNLTFNGAASQTNHVIYNVNGSMSFNGVFTVTDGRTRDGILNIGAAGTMRKNSGGGVYTISEVWNGGPRSFNNSGLVEATSGTIQPMTNGTHSGTFRGGVVFVGGTNHTMLSGSTVETGVQLSGATWSIPTASDSIQIVGSPEWTTGTIASTGGQLIGPGTLQLISGGSKTISGTLTSTVAINHSNGELYMTNATFNNNGAIALSGPRRYRDGIFNNYGSLTMSTGDTAVLGETWNGGTIQVNNHGSFLASAGVLAIVNSGTHSGTFTGAGGTVDFNAGTHTFNAGHVLNSGVRLDGGVFQVPAGGMLNTNGAVQMAGGTLQRSGSGEGRIGGAGSLSVNGGSPTFATILRNEGVINLTGSLYTTNATITNAGTLNLNGIGNYRDGVLNNTGTINKTGAGAFQLGEQWYGGPNSVNNSGFVNGTDGTLVMRASGTHSGKFNATAGQIQFPASTQTCNTGTEFNGNILFNGATVTVPAGQQALFAGPTWVAGTLNGSGSLSGAGPFTWQGSLTCPGSLSSNVPINMVSHTTYLTNGTLINSGTITLNSSITRDGNLTNNGLIKSIAGNSVLSEGYYGGPRLFSNNGEVLADGSTIQVRGPGSHSGAFRTANGGTILFNGDTHTMRIGSILGLGTLMDTPIVCNEYVQIEDETQWRSNTWSGTGTIYGDLLRITTAASHSLSGSLTCEADISYEAGVLYGTNASFTIRNSTCTVNDGVLWRDGIWNNEGRVQKVTGAGTVALAEAYFGGTRRWTNSGTLHCESGGLSVSATLTNWDGGAHQINGGTYSARGTGRLILPITNVTSNVGRFIYDGPSAQITQSNGTSPALSTIASNGGGIELYNGATLNPPGALANTGDVVIGVGSSMSPTGNYTQSAGLTHVNGTLPKHLLINGGKLSGIGTFNGATVTAAEVAPGSILGTLHSLGDVGITNSLFNVQVKNSSPNQFDRFDVLGTATISGGTLQADAAPNSTVPSGTVVDVLTASTRMGAFTTVPNPADWTVSYGGTYVRLTANRTIVGPIQIEGTVDLNGYVASYTTVPLTFTLSQSGVPVETHVVNPNANQSYAITTRKRGSFDLTVVGSHWLVRLYPTPLTLTDAGIVGVGISMINGDVDQDNEIGPGDFAALSAAFGSVDGDANWNANADLDGDEEIGPNDYAILSANFGLVGD